MYPPNRSDFSGPRVSVVVAVVVAVAVGVLACDHSALEAQLMGRWVGSIPLPATHELAPIAYEFSEEGLEIEVGLPGSSTIRHWSRWEVHREEEGDLLVYIYEEDGRVLSTLIRRVADDELLLWDAGLEESTGARVRRVSEGTGESTP